MTNDSLTLYRLLLDSDSWFRQQKYASFQRQLNIYGFKRITAGPDKGGYYNELFLRGKPGLAYRINRMKLKGTGVRQAASPETEPCLYNYSYLPRTNVAKTTRLVQSPPCATAASAGESISLRSLAPTLFSFSSAAFPSPDVGATTSIRNPVSSVSILQASQAFPYAKNPFRTSPMTEREILLANLVSTTSSGSSIPGAKDRNDLSNYLSPFF